MWENNRKQDDRLHSIDLFHEWSDKENFSTYAHWDALKVIMKDDLVLQGAIINDYRETKRKLNKIAEAFEIINDLNSNNQ